MKRFRHRRAFTIIELLVVILVLAILIAVAAPSFLGQQNKAHDSSAQQQLTVAYRSGKASFVDESKYSQTGATGDVNTTTMIGYLHSSEPQLIFTDFATGVSTSTDRQIAVETSPSHNGQVVTYANRSKSGTIFCIQTIERNLTVDGVTYRAGVYRSWGKGAQPCGGPTPFTAGGAEGGSMPTNPDLPVSATNPPVPGPRTGKGPYPLPFPPGPIAICTTCDSGNGTEDPGNGAQAVGTPNLYRCGTYATPGKSYRQLVADTGNLAANWRFDEGAGSFLAADSTGHGYTAQWSQGASGYSTGVPGFIGSAVDFGNGLSALVVPTAQSGGPDLYRKDAFPFRTGGHSYYTFETWAYIPSGRSNAGGLLFNRDSYFGGYQASVSSTQGSFGREGGSASQLNSSTPRFDVPQDQWFHFVGTDDGTTIKLYLDGHLIATRTTTADEGDTGHPFTLGNDSLSGIGSYGAPGSNDGWNALMDETAFYSRPLTDNEVCQHFLAGMQTTPTPLLADATKAASYTAAVQANNPWLWWRLDEAAGATTVANATSNAPLSPSVTSNVQLGQDSPVGNKKAALVNGASSAWTFGYSSLHALAWPFSVEFWAKGGNNGSFFPATSSSTRATILDRTPGYQANYQFQVIKSTGQVRFWIGGTNDCVSRATVEDNKWHHFVGAVDSAGYMRLYIDGVMQCSAKASHGQNNSSGGLSLGKESSNGAHMYIDEVALYQNTLSAADVRRHYLSR